MKDYYTILGISRNASQEEIKHAYRNLAKKWHPDICKKPEAEERFKEINEAYEALSNDSVSKNDLWDTFFGNAFRQFDDSLSSYNQAKYSKLEITFDGNISENDIMEIRRMLASKGCKVVGHSVIRRY